MDPFALVSNLPPVDPVDLLSKLTSIGINIAQLTKMLLDASHNNRREALELFNQASISLIEVDEALTGAIDDFSKAVDENSALLKEAVKSIKKTNEKLKEIGKHADGDMANEIKKLRKDVKAVRAQLVELAVQSQVLERHEETFNSVRLAVTKHKDNLAGLAPLIHAKYGDH